MKVVFSMPGRHGDVLWAMPSVRALAETYDQPIDLILSPKYRSLAELLRLQPYVGSVSVDPAWEVREEAPMQPRIPPTPIEADLVIHGGYEGWPKEPLPYEIYHNVRMQADAERWYSVDLARPWITTTPFEEHPDVVVGFSDEWFELKVGLRHLLQRTEDFAIVTIYGEHSRWEQEYGTGFCTDWTAAAAFIGASSVFLGCCSALHVLAVGLGKPCVIMEPNEMRWQDVFWPLGKIGPRVTLVLGGNGRPTHDARHVADTLRQVLSTVRTGGTLDPPA